MLGAGGTGQCFEAIAHPHRAEPEQHPNWNGYSRFRLHPLKDRMKGRYAVTVSANWRLTFRFEDGHAVDVGYLDYYQDILTWH